MDPTNDEQTQLLREIWNQLKTVDRTLNDKIDALGDRLDARIDALGDRLDARIDETNRELRTFRLWTQENFTRAQRNFDRLLETRNERFEAIDARLERLERHTGLTD